MSDIENVVHPGWIKSRNDGDVHWIGGARLVRLHGLNPHRTIIADPDGRWRRGRTADQLAALRHYGPQYDYRRADG